MVGTPSARFIFLGVLLPWGAGGEKASFAHPFAPFLELEPIEFVRAAEVSHEERGGVVEVLLCDAALAITHNCKQLLKLVKLECLEVDATLRP